MKRFAQITDGLVTNVAIWDGLTECAYLDGAIEVPADVPAGPGWTYDGTNFIAPPVIEPKPL